MKPTEQDNELRKRTGELIIEAHASGYILGTWAHPNISGDNSREPSNPEDITEQIMQLITADRKRVANADREVLKDLVVRAAPDGTQDDGDFVGFYVLPTGSIHRVIAYFQDKGGIETLGDASVISRYQAHIKRVALEARIDELERVYPQLQKHRGISGEGNYYYDDRIAQLKAQQEEVK